MAFGVGLTHGHFSPGAIVLIGVAAVGLLSAARLRLPEKNRASTPAFALPLETLLAATLVVFLVLGTLDAPGYYLESARYRPACATIQLGLALAVGVTLLRRGSATRFPAGIFFAGAVAGFALRVAMIPASPAPRIDVFTQFQESAAHLLHGLNPYATRVSDPYAGKIDYGYHVTGYAYPPANLYPHTLAYFLLGDIRYACVAFEIVAMACLYALVPSSRQPAARLLVLLFLFHPRGLFVIEQAWTEPLLVGAAGVFVWLAARRPHSRWLAVAFGFFLSLKQYLVFFAILFLARPKRWRLVFPVAAVVLLTWLPFLLWDARSAIENGLLFQFRTPFRPDGLTLSSVAFRWFGYEPTKWVAIGVGSLVTGIAGRKFRDAGLGGYLYASLIATLSAFLVGSQAFCNYYYFLGALVLFLIALRLREEEPDAA